MISLKWILFLCSQCNKLTSDGVSELLQYCQSLEVLRWGYDPILPNVFLSFYSPYLCPCVGILLQMLTYKIL